MQRRWTNYVTLVACLVAILGGSAALRAADERQPVNMIVLNGAILTMDSEIPQAEAFAVRGDRIAEIDSSEAIRRLSGPDTIVIDANGKAVVPGFNDAHLHPAPIYDEASPLGRVPCDPDSVANMDELIERLRAKAVKTAPGEWVKGSRYQDTKLGRHPTRDDLDRVSTRHPVYVSHSSGHVAAANSFALDLAGVTAATPDPRGGKFDRDANGRPTGVLRESAKSVVTSAGPDGPTASTAEWIAGMQRQFDEYSKQGLTSIQIAGTSPRSLRRYAQALGERRSVRIYAMLRREYLAELKTMVADGRAGDEWLKVGAIKTFHGNSLSGQTCWLYEPYFGKPDYYGIPPAVSQETLNRRVLEIHRAGFQACIHSNGDREIDMVLNAYEAALKAVPRADHRHRIEHASVCNSRILERAKELGVVLALHSYIWEHGDKMEVYGPERWPWMQPNGSAIRGGIPVAGTSDSPVSAARPLLRIQSMVTRQSAEGKVYGAEQRITVEQAIYAWTMGSAYASFDEEIKGSITTGKLADFVVLSNDPRRVPAEKIKDIAIDLTVVGGKVVYKKDREDTK